MRLVSPTSHDELIAALDRLIVAAYHNNVAVSDYRYDLRHDDGTVPDWEVTITKLA